MGRSCRSFLLIGAQGAIGLTAVLAMAMTPPAEGKMMIVSLTGETPAQIAAWATDRDTLPLGAGPMGSLVVQARAHDLAAKAWRHGGFVIAGPLLECGARTKA
jgi:hypothetical protein